MGGSLNGRTLENPTAIPRPSSVSGGREVLLAPGAAFRAQQPGSYVGGAGERSEPERVSHEEDHLTLKGTLTKISAIN